MNKPRSGKNRKTAHSSDRPQVENATVYAEDDDVKENLVEDSTVGEEDKTRTEIWGQIAGTAACATSSPLGGALPGGKWFCPCLASSPR